MADINEEIKKVTETKDHTAEFEEKDIQDNKVMAILAYLGILVLIPIFAAKESRFARFHSNQGLVLAIAEIGLSVVMSILGWIPILNIIIAIVAWIGEIGCIVLTILGIVNAASGKAKELPLIGGIKILK